MPAEDRLQRGPAPAEDEIYEYITRGIVSKSIRPGSRIREAALAERFNVGRARVRRVLRRLAELDVIEFRLNRGACVSLPLPAESRAVFQTRRVLEAEAVRGAARLRDNDAISNLETFVQREIIAHSKRRSGLTAFSSGFHTMVADMCGNPVLAKILKQLVHRCVLIQALYERQSARTICLVDEHAEIARMIREGRAKDAVVAMDRHIDHIEDSLDYSKAELMDDASPAPVA